MQTNRGRPKAFDEDEVLMLAMNYFWENGYEQTNLESLLTAMHIKKSSFYATFKSKEEVFSRALSLYRKEALAGLEALKESVGAKDALLSLVQMSMDEMKETGSIKGCLLVNSSQECYKTHPQLSKQIHLEFNYFMDIFEDYIEEGKGKGEINNPLASAKIAGRFTASMNGLVSMIQAGASDELIDDLLEHLKELLH